ncbi:MAG: proline--tRNA ligase [Candidatus Omnitrophica bacterium]|nr:proline--tRNA ligase [Candidatus Omnitrophota bacterium]
MLFSKYFIPTLREVKEESVSFRFSLKAGLISPLASGIYSYLPLGLRVLRRIEAVVRKNMNSLGAYEVLLPALQPLELWQKTKRSDLLGEVMIKFKDRRGRILCLGPTHEEVITDLVSKYVSSYRELPLILYQIQTKFRDELRPKGGLVRSCEFIMKDAYSFDKNEEGLEKSYQSMYSAYEKIFKECGLKPLVFSADVGFIGGSASCEFLIESSSGEDNFFQCRNCGFYFRDKDTCPKCKSRDYLEKKGLELGHIFKLGTIYSEKLGAYFLDEEGKRLAIVMGCYGIGVSRLLSGVIEQNYDSEGIIWPESIAPFDIEIVCLNPEEEEILSFCFQVYNTLSQQGFQVLLDERAEYSGVKFKDAYLIGIPYLIVVGKKNFSEDKLEFIRRRDKKKLLIDKKNYLEPLINSLREKNGKVKLD